MQLEATDWSIRPTLVVHPQGFTPTFVTFSTGVDTMRLNPAPNENEVRGRLHAHLHDTLLGRRRGVGRSVVDFLRGERDDADHADDR